MIKIMEAIVAARKDGLVVRHRVSIPDFERFLGAQAESKDKPLTAYRNVTDNPGLSDKVQKLLNDLLSSSQHEPFSDEALSGADYLAVLRAPLMAFAVQQGLQDTLRYKGKGTA